MKNTKNGILPMKNTEWMRTGVKQEGASLMTPLGLIEADVLDVIDSKGAMTLTDLLQQSKWPEAMTMMGAGALIREGLIQAKRHDQFIYLEKANF